MFFRAWLCRYERSSAYGVNTKISAWSTPAVGDKLQGDSNSDANSLCDFARLRPSELVSRRSARILLGPKSVVSMHVVVVVQGCSHNKSLHVYASVRYLYLEGGRQARRGVGTVDYLPPRYCQERFHGSERGAPLQGQMFQ